VFKVGIIIIIFHFLFIRNNFFFSKFFLKLLVIFLLFTSSFQFSLFCPFFSNNNCQIRKISNQKKHVAWGGGGGFNPIIQCQNFPKLCYFYFDKGNKNKIYFYIINIMIYIYSDFFKLCN